MMGDMRHLFRVLITAASLGLTVCGIGAFAQMRYATGQNVGPVFEGWMRQPDGSLRFLFGYLNRNHEEILDVPVGANNRCEPGPADCGQPTHFMTRRHRFVFAVPVPKGWDPKAVMRWSVTSNGKTDGAKAWLHPEMEINYAVMSENNGGGILEDGNTPPRLVQGSDKQTLTASQGMTLNVTMSDDGLPLRREAEAQRAATAAQRPAADAAQRPAADAAPAAASAAAERRRPGVRIRWYKYRGPGKVTFDPPTAPAVHGTPAEATTNAVFSAPGTYVVRASATDGQLETHHDITVVVQ